MSKNQVIYNQAIQLLNQALNSTNSSFREGQYEAIEAVFTHRRSLVVQKTGWGKSLVYFISTKINRGQKKGVSIVISPLLVLIENQIEAAKKVNLKCQAIFSGNADDHFSIIQQLKRNEIDILFTTPESLFNILQPHLKDIRLGMFIIDEAHCISDWGHDFRLDYRKIVEVLNELKDKDFQILATTATANDRVIEDLMTQIGPNLYVSKGSLYRDNLYVQLIELESKQNRYAWILQNINQLNGTGIIYCLTQKDCDDLATFLSSHKILARAYHSGLDKEVSDEAIHLFSKNKIKVLVATIKFGMGYDKPDVAFVIHYQVPKNIVSYYQQIGRAARNIKEGYTFLLKGGNDFEILNYFIRNAFPSKQDMEKILSQFDQLAWGKSGISTAALAKNVNLSYSRINKALKFLEFEHVLNREKKTYFLTTNKFHYNEQHYQQINQARLNEIEQLKALFETEECLNKKIIETLDDTSPIRCGKCVNCLKKPILSISIDAQNLVHAKEFLDNHYLRLVPRDKELLEGIILSKYGDEPIGRMVAESKYNNQSYPEPIIAKAIKVLTPMVNKYNLKSIAFVPSLNNQLMNELAQHLAKRMGLELIDPFIKLSNTSQKTMENHYWQKKNIQENYELKPSAKVYGKNLILIDDMIDSGYTMSILGAKLMEAGAKQVFPFALADSGERNVDND
jgi:ATP-dependent DNA helicase RecQ